MLNSDVFKNVFGMYATELWAMEEKDYLKWLNSEYKPRLAGQWIPIQPDERGYSREFYCSECGYVVKLPYATLICDRVCCHHCGAKMGEILNYKQ